MTKYITEKEARRVYNLGAYAKAKGLDYYHELENAGPQVWSYYCAFDLGYEGKPFLVEDFERFGDVKSDDLGYPYPSHNYRDHYNEDGVSVMDDAWKQTVSGMFFMARGGKIIKLRGIRCGTGSDGEPVVLPIA